MSGSSVVRLGGALSLCAMALTGCVSLHQDMTAPDGVVRRECQWFGMGVLGVPAALIEKARCVKNLEAKGYTKVAGD